MEIFLLGFLMIAIAYLLFTVSKLENRVQNMKYRQDNMKRTLDQVAEKIEIPENPINDKLRKLIKEGKDVEAVKAARESMGLSLTEGKRYVDDLKAEER